MFETTQFRVVTRIDASPVSSAIRTASSAVKVGATRAHRRPPPGAHRRRDLAAACPAGRVSLQKRSPRGRWAVVKRRNAQAARREPLALQLQGRRAKRKRPAARYRVVVLARDGGAHVPGRSREVRVASTRKR